MPLGVPLYQESFPSPAVLGVRYWRVNENGRLFAPISGGLRWSPGLNKARCASKGCKNTACSCGLYAFKYHPSVSTYAYFDLVTAVPTPGQHAVIGGVMLFNASLQNINNGAIIKAKYGCVSALVRPQKGVGKTTWSYIRRAAQRYQVEIVEPSELQKASETYLEETFPNFYVSPEEKERRRQARKAAWEAKKEAEREAREAKRRPRRAKD